ncbi:hypothetical protein ABIB82_000109 [Bradyrhizobium sp. i1.8.4]
MMDINALRTNAVMAGHSRPRDGIASARLCPAIHDLTLGTEDVDARVKPGHDDTGRFAP